MLLTATVLAVLFAVAPLAVPLLEENGSDAAPLLRLAYHPLCHQLPSRSLELAARPLGVCARCQGLYLGAALGVLAAAIARRSPAVDRRLIALVWGVNLVDAALAALALPSLPNWPRFAVAIPAGVLAGALLAEALADLSRSMEEEQCRTSRLECSSRP